MSVNPDYLSELKTRAKRSRAYSKHQLLGLEIANILEDLEHKSLYIKLAKEQDSRELLRLAKDVSERKEVRNKGAYFMKIAMAELKKTKLFHGERK